MKKAYASGDPYLEFAELARALPADATKKTHPEQRALTRQKCLLFNMEWAQSHWLKEFSNRLLLPKTYYATLRSFPNFLEVV